MLPAHPSRAGRQPPTARVRSARRARSAPTASTWSPPAQRAPRTDPAPLAGAGCRCRSRSDNVAPDPFARLHRAASHRPCCRSRSPLFYQSPCSHPLTAAGPRHAAPTAVRTSCRHTITRLCCRTQPGPPDRTPSSVRPKHASNCWTGSAQPAPTRPEPDDPATPSQCSQDLPRNHAL